jgi:hypothetical protein
MRLETWYTAIFLMVMSFLKEICFTIFSAPLFKVELGDTRKYIGLVWVLAVLYAVVCGSIMYVASLVCLAVVLAGLEVTYKWNVKKNELEAPLLNP